MREGGERDFQYTWLRNPRMRTKNRTMKTLVRTTKVNLSDIYEMVRCCSAREVHWGDNGIWVLWDEIVVVENKRAVESLECKDSGRTLQEAGLVRSCPISATPPPRIVLRRLLPLPSCRFSACLGSSATSIRRHTPSVQNFCNHKSDLYANVIPPRFGAFTRDSQVARLRTTGFSCWRVRKL